MSQTTLKTKKALPEYLSVMQTIRGGFGILLLLILVLVTSAVYQIHKNQTDLGQLVNETHRKMLLAHIMSEAIVSHTKRFYAILIKQDAFERDNETQMLAHHTRDFIMAREAFLKQPMNADEKQLLDELAIVAQQAHVIMVDVLKALDDGIERSAMDPLIMQSEVSQQKVISLINSLVEHTRTGSASVIEQSRVQNTDARNLLLMLTVLFILFGVIIGEFVLRKVAEQNKKIIFQAHHDSLTGLMNRASFEQEIKQAIDSPPPHKSLEFKPRYHALYYLDLDQFKIVNDTCGHYVGDQLLQELTKLLDNQFSRQVILSRVGGDEFGVLHLNVDDSLVDEMVEKLLTTVRSFRFVWDERLFYVGVSIGIYRIDECTQSASIAMSGADAACYLAKDEGRNRAHYFEDKDLDIDGRMADMGWLARINKALTHDYFQLYCQKIQSLQGDHQPVHYEVLLRLSEAKNVLYPGSFIPPAERFGLMPFIDKWVVKHTIEWLEKYGLNEDSEEYFSINLSGNSLGDRTLLDFIYHRLLQSSIPASHITFEITETAAINNLQQALTFIRQLNQLGCCFSLDDFGSGLSSFGYLKELPVQYLKIDGLFVKNCVNDPIDLALVHSIHEVGHIMNMETIAEFVEDKETLDMLQSLGVDYAQGYYVGKPMPIDQLFYDKL